MHPIGLIVKTIPEAQQTADRLEAWLGARKVAVKRIRADALNNANAADTRHLQIACVFVMGGD